MSNLTRASNELFRRSPDECFPSLDALRAHCDDQKRLSLDRWHPPQELIPADESACLSLALGHDGVFRPNDWSFGQLCKLAGISKDTVNRLAPATASQVFRETLPTGNKPLQVLTQDDRIRSIHGVAYTRLYNADLVEMLLESADGFEPPQTAMNGYTGLYCGEQDMFCFLIDPLGWTEIEGEAFAPGFFLWNSEVGRRSLGIQTFWFQAICQNHIVWDAVEIVEFTRKHTANVHDSTDLLRNLVQGLVDKRDERREAFVKVVWNAMKTRLGDDAEKVAKVLAQHGIPRNLAKQALDEAERQGRFTIFALVDTLTRLAGQIANAGDRLEADTKASALLALAA